MEYSGKMLKKQSFCTTAQALDLDDMQVSSASSNPLSIYKIVTMTIKQILNGDLEKAEIKSAVDSAGELSELPSEDERLKANAVEMIENFFSLTATWTGKCFVPDSSVVVKLPYTGNNDDYARIRPDVVWDDGVTIIVGFIKTGSSYIMGDEFLPTMYNAILYGRSLVPYGESRTIQASYIEVKGTLQKAKVQSIIDDIWPLPDGVDSEQDDKAKAEWEELSQGVTCEGKDCDYCPGRFQCRYQAPALAVEGEKIIKPKKVLLSDAQKLIQAFGA